MIGIIIAMENELNEFMNFDFDHIEKISIRNRNFFKIKHNNNEFILCFCGIGKVNASTFTTLMIDNFEIDAIINIGSAGIYNNAQIGDVIMANKVSYCDVDVTGFGYDKNQVPKMPVSYTIKNKFFEMIKAIIGFKLKEGVVYSSDSFINTNNVDKFTIIKEGNLPILVEMEACAIAQTCFLLNIDFIFIKIAIDKIFEPITNEKQFNDNLINISKKIDSILLNIIKNW